MVQRENVNKGKKLDVDPIRDVECIIRIEKMLAGKPRDLLLFVLGINSGLRLMDLLNITCGQLLNTPEGDYFEIRETKTGKQNIVVINKPVAVAVRKYFKAFPERTGDMPVFFSAYLFFPVAFAYKNKRILFLHMLRKSYKGFYKSSNIFTINHASRVKQIAAFLQRELF